MINTKVIAIGKLAGSNGSLEEGDFFGQILLMCYVLADMNVHKLEYKDKIYVLVKSLTIEYNSVPGT